MAKGKKIGQAKAKSQNCVSTTKEKKTSGKRLDPTVSGIGMVGGSSGNEIFGEKARARAQIWVFEKN